MKYLPLSRLANVEMYTCCYIHKYKPILLISRKYADKNWGRVSAEHQKFNWCACFIMNMK